MINRFKERRKELGLTFKQLEELTGISRSTLQRYEANNMQRVRMDNLEIIANAIDVPVGYLIGWSSKKISSARLLSINTMLNKIDYNLEYCSDTDEFILSNNDITRKVTEKQIVELEHSTLEYLKFKINEMKIF